MASRGLSREQVINDVLLDAQPTKEFVTAGQVAALAVYLCRDEATSITGTDLSMDGGWTAARVGRAGARAVASQEARHTGLVPGSNAPLALALGGGWLADH